jgi:hypothetical protein
MDIGRGDLIHGFGSGSSHGVLTGMHDVRQKKVE